MAAMAETITLFAHRHKHRHRQTTTIRCTLRYVRTTDKTVAYSGRTSRPKMKTKPEAVGCCSCFLGCVELANGTVGASPYGYESDEQIAPAHITVIWLVPFGTCCSGWMLLGIYYSSAAIPFPLACEVDQLATVVHLPLPWMYLCMCIFITFWPASLLVLASQQQSHTNSGTRKYIYHIISFPLGREHLLVARFVCCVLYICLSISKEHTPKYISCKIVYLDICQTVTDREPMESFV